MKRLAVVLVVSACAEPTLSTETAELTAEVRHERFALIRDAAAEMGLYNRVVPAEQLMAEATDVAVRLARGPSVALGVTKQALNEEASMDLARAIEWEARAQADCMRLPDFREAYEAFRAKREPRFE